jgi:hypothetical protein
MIYNPLTLVIEVAQWRLHLPILCGKFLVRHGEIHNAFYGGDDERNGGNSEQIAQKPLTMFTKVKLVNPDTTKENGK